MMEKVIRFFLGVALSISAVEGSSDHADKPFVLGRAVERFEVGELVAKDNFADLSNWIVQVQEREGFPEQRVEANNGTLDCFVPGRGCTVWFKEKLKTRMAITYEVICPEPEEGVRGVQVKDVNNFWLAADPRDPTNGLFNSKRYTGDFTDYHEMNGYYASSGGGRNTTTRFRRYPREEDGELTEHIALKERDGQTEFMLTPGKRMKVQLVAFDDLVQYIVDGKLVYEVAFGDEVAVERFRRGVRMEGTDDYDDDEFPFYKEGYFGFRMVGTHHIYSNFRVYELNPIEVVRKQVVVESLEQLREVARMSHQDIKMKPGTYVVRDISQRGVGFHFSGSQNVFDFTGVTFEVPMSTLDKMAERGRRNRRGTYFITGDGVVFRGGEFINVYEGEIGEKIDFGSYNQDPDNYPDMGVTEMRVRGDDCRLEGCKMIVRGSFPYGYGNMYGIGESDVVDLKKHCAIQVTGDRAVIDGCEIKMEAFGHAIYVQGGDDILVKNTYVEGEVRKSNDLYREKNEGDLAKKFDYEIQWPENVEGLAIPKNHMINLVEDGIRAYNGTRKMTVENCKVVRMRGGIKLYMADEGIIRNSEVLDCVIQGFSVPAGGIIENCRGNAAYGPLLYIHMNQHEGQKVDIKVLPAPHGIGDHPLAAIKGGRHSIRFTSSDDKGAQLERPIIVGFPMRFDYLSVDYPEVPEGMEELFERFAPEDYRAKRISLTNETGHPVVLSKHSENNRVQSRGKVKDLGEDNELVAKME